MTKAKEIEILKKDNCTESEAKKYLDRGTVVYEDFEEYFEQYMQEWGFDEVEQEPYRKMITEKKAVDDWSVVEYEGKYYYIQYVL